MKKIFTLLLATIIGLLSVPVMSAAALQAGDITMAVRPSEQNIELHPGEYIDGSIQVSNNGRLDFNFTVSTSAFRVTNENYDTEFSDEGAAIGLPSWISFDQTAYHITPGEKIEVPFHIAVPEDIPDKSQYAAILVRTQDSSEEGATVRLVTQIAALIYGSVIDGETHEVGTITTQSMNSLLLSKKFSATTTVENSGNIDFRFMHKLNIRDFFTGRDVINSDTVDDDGNPVIASVLTVLPGTSRTNTLTWDDAPTIGIFRVRQSVSFLDEEQTDEKIIFICPMWLVIAVAAFIALLILWLIVRVANRKNHNPQVF